ncbi:NF-X1-type zinc finger protein NFXL1 [Habropoda laboriosa]|uniref:NF-X1-type zinc finger protein NFXL1 n=1 Tax=Habropoda laboriosa TaxID=597456 RepID=A0A0L7QUY2_9HYME|nr:NF-X1-type zinc finger protein NFXL1 [Habropoda laboriosa]
MQKFRRAQAENKIAINKHLEANAYLGSSSEDENEKNEEDIQTVVEKVLSAYKGKEADAEKILSYLINIFESGSAVCLICISTVKKADPIWNCSKCFAFLHLSCILHWIQDSLNVKREKGLTLIWACPKCRMEYGQDEIPHNYKCFCKKVINPPHQPWNIPHSCGEICDKLLQPECGHKCVLLCHPGPCPPCAKILSIKCYCGKQMPQQRRCNTKEWSCGTICNKKYKLCSHICKEVCHTGECPPCSELVLLECHCKSNKELKLCSEGTWVCDKPCDRSLSCNVHTCQSTCHLRTDCGPCPLEKNRTCPCGKKRYAISCKQEHLPTCGDTCGKLLDCASHCCNMRCHTDRCGQCLEVVTKSCRCGSYKKEVACGKEFHCNKKCMQMRLCGRHLCNRKCCDCVIKNTYNVCEKVCNNTLNCRKHKCFAPCHSGPCYPCAQTDVIQCRCGYNKIRVPCGTVKKIKPPPCNKPCKIPPICHHPKRETHKCHQGPCPPCKKILQVTCLGGHETRPWLCHMARPTSCGRLCGKMLPCTNHTCELVCHRVPSSDGDKNTTPCMECEQPCQFPCKQLVKISCHCGIGTLYRRCAELTSATTVNRNELLKCGNQCPKNLSCGHRCMNNCHPDLCMNEKECNKKVKLFCACKRIKKDFICSVVQKEEIHIECDNVCIKLKNEKRQAQVALLEQERRAEKIRNQQEIEKFERKFKPRRKGKDKFDKKQLQKKICNSYKKYWILAIFICLIGIVIIYVCVKKS